MFSVLWDAAWTMVLQWSARLLNSHLLLAQDWVFSKFTRKQCMWDTH
jgi:hypothetical protein